MFDILQSFKRRTLNKKKYNPDRNLDCRSKSKKVGLRSKLFGFRSGTDCDRGSDRESDRNNLQPYLKRKGNVIENIIENALKPSRY